MKNQKLIVIAAIVCLLLGASGAAMAAECAAGFIFNENLMFLTVDGTSCLITDSLIKGDVTVTNSPDFAMKNCRVFGSVTVIGGENTVIADTKVEGGDITVEETTDTTWLLNNKVGAGNNMVIQNNTNPNEGSDADVAIYSNVVTGGIWCIGNDEVIEEANTAAFILCPLSTSDEGDIGTIPTR